MEPFLNENISNLSPYTYDDFIEDPYSVEPENFLEMVSKIRKEDIETIAKKLSPYSYEDFDCPDDFKIIIHETQLFYTNENAYFENMISNYDQMDLLKKNQMITDAKFFTHNGPGNTFLLHFLYPRGYDDKSFQEDYEDFRIGEIVLIRKITIEWGNVQFYGKIHSFYKSHLIIKVETDQVREYLPLILYYKSSNKTLSLRDESKQLHSSFAPDIIVLPKRNLLDSYLALVKNIHRLLINGRVANKPLIEFILSPKLTASIIDFIPEIEFFDKDLNEYQKRAVFKAIAAPLFFQIDGPPGTGKTRLQCEIILQLAKRGQKVLVATPSPAALENIIERVVASKKVVACHLGTKEKELVKSEIHIEKLCENNKIVKQASKSTQNVIDLIRESNSEDKNFLSQELKKLKNIQDECVNGLAKIVLEVSEVVFATLPDVTDPHIERENIFFDVCIIDECSQAIEIASWIPIIRSRKLVISGDEGQLVPLVFSEINKQQELNVTLFSRMKEKIPEIESENKKIKDPSLYELLRIQYRMNSDIAEWSNQMFYKGMLITDDACSHISLDEFSKPENKELADKLMYINTHEKQCFEQNFGTSKINIYEVAYVLKVINYLEGKYNLDQISIGVITPYKAQSDLISKILKQYHEQKSIKCSTIDAYQGKEKDIIILSMVRSNNHQSIGFINDPNRLNVSVTRAKRLLVVIGNHYTLSGDNILKSLLEHLIKRGKDFSNHNLFKYIPSDILESIKKALSGESDKKIIDQQYQKNHYEKSYTKNKPVREDQRSDFPPVSYNRNDSFTNINTSEPKPSTVYEKKSDQKVNTREKTKEYTNYTVEYVVKK